VLLETDWLKNQLAIDRTPDALAKIAAMDDPNNMDELADIGRLAAARQVKPEHFPAAFDIT
jgi:hypothetical protein